MIRHYFTILTILITSEVQGQSLTDIEERLRLLENLPEFGQLDKVKYDTTGFSKLPSFDYYCDDENENKWSYYHVIDLNNDGKNDLVYSGPCMPYSGTGVFLNKGDRLDLIHSYPGEVLSIEQEATRTLIQILKWPCCCDVYFDYYEIKIYNNFRVEKNLISFEAGTKITLAKLKEIKIKGIVRSTNELNDNEKKDECSDEMVKGNQLTLIAKTTSVIQLAEQGHWRLIIFNEDKKKSWIGWIQLD